MTEKAGIEKQIKTKVDLVNKLRYEEAITASAITKFEYQNRIETLETEIQGLRDKLDKLGNQIKNSNTMDLKQFKKDLKLLVDKGELSDVFEEIQDTEGIAYTTSQFYSLRNRAIDGEKSTDFKQQVKVFIGTIEKK